MLSQSWLLIDAGSLQDEVEPVPDDCMKRS